MRDTEDDLSCVPGIAHFVEQSAQQKSGRRLENKVADSTSGETETHLRKG
jgi:hypothetical protein